MIYESLSRGWNLGPIKSKPWVIEKERRLTCFGSPGYVMQWDHWQSYDTRAEAEDALKKLYENRDPMSTERFQIIENRGNRWVKK